MPPDIQLVRVENESNVEIFAEEHKELSLKVINSKSWDKDENWANHNVKIGVSLNESKVKMNNVQMINDEILFSITVDVPGTYIARCRVKVNDEHVDAVNSPMNIVVRSRSDLESRDVENKSMSRRGSVAVQWCQDFKTKKLAEDLNVTLDLDSNDNERNNMPMDLRRDSIALAQLCDKYTRNKRADNLNDASDLDSSFAQKVPQENDRCASSIAVSVNQDISKFQSWKKVLSIQNGGGKGVNKPIGICILPSKQVLVVASTFEIDIKEKGKARGKVKMFAMNGTFLKEIFCPEEAGGAFVKPSDMASISDEKFAVRDKSRIMIFDDNGDYVQTVPSSGGMECFGLAVDGSCRLACLMVRSSTKQLYIQRYDLKEGKPLDKIDLVDVLGNNQNKSICRFLTYHSGKFYVTDNGLNKVYVVHVDQENEKEESVSIKEFSKPNDDPFHDPGGVVLDNFGNIIVADSKNHRLCLFNSDHKWIRNIQVRFWI